MSPIRTIKPSFFKSDDVSAAPYRKKAIPQAVRRAVARRHGASYEAGGGTAPCRQCGEIGRIYWLTPSWVTFDHELDHIHPERLGGKATADNIDLACLPCNRRKGARWTG
jgi:5-methylcytosine-specific restriction endonuclease McrA